MTFIEDQRALRALRGCPKGVAEKLLKVCDPLRKLLAVMTIAVVEFIIQGHLALGMAKQGRIDLAYIGAALCVFAAFGDVTAGMKRIDKGAPFMKGQK